MSSEPDDRARWRQFLQLPLATSAGRGRAGIRQNSPIPLSQIEATIKRDPPMPASCPPRPGLLGIKRLSACARGLSSAPVKLGTPSGGDAPLAGFRHHGEGLPAPRDR